MWLCVSTTWKQIIISDDDDNDDKDDDDEKVNKNLHLNKSDFGNREWS